MMKIQDLSIIEMLKLDRSDRRVQGGEGLSISVEVLGIEGLDSKMSKSRYTILGDSILSTSVFSRVTTIPGGMVAVSRSSSSITTIPGLALVSPQFLE